MFEKIKNVIIKKERYVKSFIEAFASYIAVNALILDLHSKCAWYALLAGAFASAISVVFNFKQNRKKNR